MVYLLQEQKGMKNKIVSYKVYVLECTATYEKYIGFTAAYVSTSISGIYARRNKPNDKTLLVKRLQAFSWEKDWRYDVLDVQFNTKAEAQAYVYKEIATGGYTLRDIVSDEDRLLNIYKK
jgi:hypothetical protein